MHFFSKNRHTIGGVVRVAEAVESNNKQVSKLVWGSTRTLLQGGDRNYFSCTNCILVRNYKGKWPKGQTVSTISKFFVFTIKMAAITGCCISWEGLSTNFFDF